MLSIKLRATDQRLPQTEFDVSQPALLERILARTRSEPAADLILFKDVRLDRLSRSRTIEHSHKSTVIKSLPSNGSQEISHQPPFWRNCPTCRTIFKCVIMCGSFGSRRGARVAESGSLENCCPGNGTVGSIPTLSANKFGD
jgi:hypothetical protein